ncbi:MULTISPECIES: ribosome maturation factor RimM [Actinomyces]|uniref:Ribosome maturation factor RimM n=1 Tax=Actinomyces marmotae TaxID=2737173 RepID=A0A6M8B8E0_9ACTO|nr:MULTISPECIES: ribosome maturation factor RimM [Actinomyces]QKD79483.1 ribosome maturation factor RimM [Actinomyces marmotae]
MQLTVAIIGPAHALKGEVRLEIRSDDPRGRLASGAVLATQDRSGKPAADLTVERLRFDGTRWFAVFAEAPDRSTAEALRGHRLLIDTDAEPEDEDDDAWYRHQLVGLAARHIDGTGLGAVTDLEPGVAQDRLIITTPSGQRVAVPFVEALVPEVDPEAGLVIIDPPGGLFPGIGAAEVSEETAGASGPRGARGARSAGQAADGGDHD